MKKEDALTAFRLRELETRVEHLNDKVNQLLRGSVGLEPLHRLEIVSDDPEVEEPEPRICAECRWVRDTTNGPHFRCQAFEYQDPITGGMRKPFCCEHNRKGDCPRYERDRWNPPAGAAK